MFRLRGVSVRYSPSAGIEIDELDIAPRGVTAVIGPSGSGKTTLLSLLAGFIHADVAKGGHLLFGDRPIAGPLPPGEVGFVFQSPMLLGAAGGSVNMLAGHAARQLNRASPINWSALTRAVSALGLTGDDGYLLAKRARQLSGGEAQRIAVLRALLADPDVILCDEPTSSLDANNAHQVMATLKDWTKTCERPALWVTHNLDQASEYADHFVFLRNGRIFTPAKEDAQALASNQPAVKLETLRRILKSFSSADPASPPSKLPHEAWDEIRVAPQTYNRWIARAFSTDSIAGAKIERKNLLALAAPDHVKALAPLLPQDRQWTSWFKGIWRLALSYPRRSLTVLLTVTMFQAIVAAVVYSASSTYYQTQLSDPALWRLTFSVDPLSDWSRTNSNKIPILNYGTLRELRSELMSGPVMASDAIKVVGRRFIDTTAIRVPGSDACGEWLTISSFILAPVDPVLRLADFGDVSRDSRATADLLGRKAEQAAHKDGLGLIVADAALHKLLRERCATRGSNAPIVVEWAPTDAEKSRPSRLTLADEVIKRMPPVHPYQPRAIIFETTYTAMGQREAASRLNARGFEQASVFLPDGDLEKIENELKKRGYSVTDDSRDALAKLQQFSAFMKYIPLVFAGLNVIAAVVSIVVMVLFQLELNRRVLTLFLAMGFRVGHIATFLLLHLLPALVVSLCACWVAVWLSWLSIVDSLPKELGSLRGEFLRATSGMTGWLVVVFLIAVLAPIVSWSRRVAHKLTENLRE